MDMKRLATGGIVGGIVLMLLGYLIYEVLMADYFAANTGAAGDVTRETIVFWSVLLGEIAGAVLLTLAMGWKGASSVGDGFKVAATVGFLAWFSVNFIIYGVTDLWNLTATIIDPIIAFVRYGIAGAVIAMVLGKMGGSASSSTEQASY